MTSERIAVTGSTGLVGSILLPRLRDRGVAVRRIIRSSPNAEHLLWDPTAEHWDATALDGFDAVVHLAGENIGASRWTAKVKQRIRDSRVRGTRLISEGLARLKSPPRTLVTASAVGFYGDRGDEELDEESRGGTGFLAEVAAEWERMTRPALEAGIRVVQLRFGAILSREGGALAKMLTPFRLGLGGKIGSGRQYWSWISVVDAVGAVEHALATESLSGPVNVVAPQAATNAEFTSTLGRVLRRPTWIPMPALAARVALGEMANELLLTSIRAVPRKLLATGFVFQHPKLEDALRAALESGEEGENRKRSEK